MSDRPISMASIIGASETRCLDSTLLRWAAADGEPWSLSRRDLERSLATDRQSVGAATQFGLTRTGALGRQVTRMMERAQAYVAARQLEAWQRTGAAVDRDLLFTSVSRPIPFDQIATLPVCRHLDAWKLAVDQALQRWIRETADIEALLVALNHPGSIALPGQSPVTVTALVEHRLQSLTDPAAQQILLDTVAEAPLSERGYIDQLSRHNGRSARPETARTHARAPVSPSAVLPLVRILGKLRYREARYYSRAFDLLQWRVTSYRQQAIRGGDGLLRVHEEALSALMAQSPDVLYAMLTKRLAVAEDRRPFARFRWVVEETSPADGAYLAEYMHAQIMKDATLRVPLIQLLGYVNHPRALHYLRSYLNTFDAEDLSAEVMTAMQVCHLQLQQHQRPKGERDVLTGQTLAALEDLLRQHYGPERVATRIGGEWPVDHSSMQITTYVEHPKRILRWGARERLLHVAYAVAGRGALPLVRIVLDHESSPLVLATARQLHDRIERRAPERARELPAGPRVRTLPIPQPVLQTLNVPPARREPGVVPLNHLQRYATRRGVEFTRELAEVYLDAAPIADLLREVWTELEKPGDPLLDAMREQPNNYHATVVYSVRDASDTFDVEATTNDILPDALRAAIDTFSEAHQFGEYRICAQGEVGARRLVHPEASLGISVIVTPKAQPIPICTDLPGDWPRWSYPFDWEREMHGILRDWSLAHGAMFGDYTETARTGAEIYLRVAPARGVALSSWMATWEDLAQAYRELPSHLAGTGALHVSMQLPQWPTRRAKAYRQTMRRALQQAFAKAPVDLRLALATDTTGKLWMPPVAGPYPCARGMRCLPIEYPSVSTLAMRQMEEFVEALMQVTLTRKEQTLLLFVDVPRAYREDAPAELGEKMRYWWQQGLTRFVEERSADLPQLALRLQAFTATTIYLRPSDGPHWRFFPLLVPSCKAPTINDAKRLQRVYADARPYWPTE